MLAWPMLGGLFSGVAFNLADTFFVGQLGAPELAAMGFTFPVATVLGSLSLGIGTGLSAVLARATGAGRTGETRRITTDGLALALAVVLLLTTLGVATIDPLFRVLGADAATLVLIRQYMTIWYAGMAFLVVPMVGNSAIRAMGDSRLPGLVMITASLVNLVLDPLLIFGLLGLPRLELQGAALATVLARALTFAVALWALGPRMGLLTFARVRPTTIVGSWRQILYVGLPAAGTNLVVPVTNAILVALVATHSTAAVAGFGVATRIEFLALVPFYALAAVIGPFVGQNLGAGERGRIVEAVRLGAYFCVAWGLGVATLLAITTPWLVALFSGQAGVVRAASLYLWIVPVSFAGAGVVMVANGALNGLGRPRPAVVVALLRMVVLYIPLAWLGSRLIGVGGIFAAGCAANLVTGVVAYRWNMRACEGCSPADAALARETARTEGVPAP
jgi:putative MATE family efflux protein